MLSTNQDLDRLMCARNANQQQGKLYLSKNKYHHQPLYAIAMHEHQLQIRFRMQKRNSTLQMAMLADKELPVSDF